MDKAVQFIKDNAETLTLTRLWVELEKMGLSAIQIRGLINGYLYDRL